jgi:hypothetical protein
MSKYTPRRQSKRWLDADCPRGVLAIYDNGGETADRYTVFYADPVRSGSYATTIIGHRGMSEQPSHPQGVGMFGEMSAYDTAAYRYAASKQACKWSEMPPAVQACVRRDLED